MKTLNPYINFAGKCREAMAFYKDCFKGEITALQTYAEAEMDVPEPFKQKVLHSELKAEGVVVMASDGQPGGAVTVGDNITLSIVLTDQAEQERVFNALADGGKVDLALQDTFWGARFGILTDRYGIHWQLNCDKKQS